MESKPEIMKMYSLKLDELTSTSKRCIDILTQLARTYISFAEDIVQAIEIRILKNFGNSNLSLFYLIDSILKNTGQEYVAYFSRNIKTYFCSALDRADEDVLPSMKILLGTWNAIIASEILEGIDSHICALEARRKGHKQTVRGQKRLLEDNQDHQTKKIRREAIPPPASQQVNVKELFGKLVAKGLVLPAAKADTQAETHSFKLIGRHRQIHEAKLRSEVKQKMLEVWDLPKEEWDKHIDAKFQMEMKAEEQEVIPSATEDFGAAVTFCGVCGDEFDQYFDDDSEEWKLHNAIKHENSYYHPVCLEDI